MYVFTAITILTLIGRSCCAQDPLSNILRLPCKHNAIFYHVADDKKMDSMNEIGVSNVADDDECMGKCLLNPLCRSIATADLQDQGVSCHLYNVDRHQFQPSTHAPEHRYYDSGYFESKVGPRCRNRTTKSSRRCSDTCDAEGVIFDKYRVGGSSCQNIRDTFREGTLPNGLYCMVGKNDRRITAFCDMTNNGGGWLRVAKVRIDRKSKTICKTHKLGSLTENWGNFVLNSEGINTLNNDYIAISQFRFYCKKDYLQRKISITTSSDSVFKYILRKQNQIPPSCGTFQITQEDSSYISSRCTEWESLDLEVGFWNRDVDYPFRITNHYEWAINGVKFRCDDVMDTKPEGEWMVFVR